MAGTITLGVIGLLTSDRANKKASRANEEIRVQNEKIRRQEKKVADVKAIREKRGLLRKARIARAEQKLTGQDDSRVQGGTGSLATRAADATGFVNFQQDAGDSIFESGNIIGQQSVNLANAQQLQQLGGTIFDVGLKYGGDITNAFKQT